MTFVPVEVRGMWQGITSQGSSGLHSRAYVGTPPCTYACSGPPHRAGQDVFWLPAQALERFSWWISNIRSHFVFQIALSLSKGVPIRPAQGFDKPVLSLSKGSTRTGDKCMRRKTLSLSEAESFSILTAIARLSDRLTMSYRQEFVSFSFDSKPTARSQVPKFQAHLGSFRFTRPLRRPWRTAAHPSR